MTSSILTVTIERTEAKLVSLEALKSELQITTSDDDDYLSRLLDRVSEGIETYCGRVFAVETVREVFRLEAHAWKKIILARRPIVEIGSVTECGVVLAEADYEIDVESGELFRLSNDMRIGWRLGKITVAYAGGYETIPGPIQQKIFDMVKLGQVSRTRDPSLRSENILEGLYSYTLFSPTDSVGGFPPDVAAVLNQYRSVAV